MKIMYVCGMYVPSHGGAEISMYSLLKKLQNEFRWEILSITDERYEKTKKLKKFNKVPLHTVSHNKCELEIEKIILEFKPNIIITQLMWSDVALRLANKYKIPSILRVCKIPFGLDISKRSRYAPTEIISTSNAVKKYVLEHWNRKSRVIKPLIEINDYLITKKGFNPYKNKIIFMFNPLERKGGLFFKEIVKRLSYNKFGTVFGWSSLKEKNSPNKFSKKYIKRITESEGSIFDGSLPRYVNFDDCKNIKIFKPKNDPKVFYEKMKILLIPSQWEEAFGRVAIEAMVNGIPVIASNVAGLRDAVGGGGILVEKNNIHEWVNEILKLNDIGYYKKISEKAKNWVKKNYSEDDILKESKNLIESTIKKFVFK